MARRSAFQPGVTGRQGREDPSDQRHRRHVDGLVFAPAPERVAADGDDRLGRADDVTTVPAEFGGGEAGLPGLVIVSGALAGDRQTDQCAQPGGERQVGDAAAVDCELVEPAGELGVARPAGLFGSAHRVGNGRGGVLSAGRAQVSGDRGVVGRSRTTLQAHRNRRVQPAPLSGGDPFGDGFADQRVGEGQAALAHCHQQSGAQGRIAAVGGVGVAAGFFGQLGLEVQSDQRRGLQHRRRRFGQLGEPAADDVVHAVRYLRRPSAVGADEGQQFGQEEGVAVGPLVQGLQDLGGEVQPS